jgi:hypothetical protein
MFTILYVLLCPILTDASFWPSYYITYSIENDTKFTDYIIKAIESLNITSLQLNRVKRGKGDIKIYFASHFPDYKLGEATFIKSIKITLNQKTVDRNSISPVVQHEMLHALGIYHNENDNTSIMYPIFLPTIQYLKNTDLMQLDELYRCSYDAVTLLNHQTYLKFRGNKYERIDLNTGYLTNGNLHPSIYKVSAMYRNKTYIIIVDSKYYEFNYDLQFIKSGNKKEKFPNIKYKITAVLTLRNNSIIAFLKNKKYIWYNNQIHLQNIFKIIPTGAIRGAYLFQNQTVALTARNYIYKYDKNFKFIHKQRLCETDILNHIHCCNLKHQS